LQRDLDLIRHILIVTESSTSSKLTIENFVTDKYDAALVSFHIGLLLGCKYIEANKVSVIGERYKQYIVKHITASGYDYLDAVRDESVWSKTKDKLKKIGTATSLDVVKSVASKVTLGLLGL